MPESSSLRVACVRALALCALLACCKASAPAADAGTRSNQPDAARSDERGDAAAGPARDDASMATRDAGRTRDAAIHAGNDAAQKPASDAAVSVNPNNGASSCENGLRDGTETDIDCGGKECGTCLSGRHCTRGTDCASGTCENGSCTCLALKACPKDACGTIRNCGSDLACGECASGVCYENRCCTPRTCEKDECGVYPDGCGGTIRCGDQSCCTPRTCAHPSLADRCGTFADQCGGNVSCSCADSKATCYLGECCTPLACDGDSCGSTLSNGCGGVTNCSCSGGATCYRGHCCKPKDCSGFAGPGCKTLDDGCGGMITCGCASGQTCTEGGTCCTKQSCGGAYSDVCGPTDDGCGTSQNCGCNVGLSCYGGRCCSPQTCTQQGRDNRCGPATDGCGGSGLWCGCAQALAIHVERRAACGHACADTLAKIAACESSAPLEVLDQTAGWDFSASLSSSACNASFGFSPNWTGCPASGGFSVDARGFIYLAAGTHCFSITGSKTNSCGALYLWTSPDTFTGWENLPSSTAAQLVSKQTASCFDIPQPDYYPIRWFYTQDGTLESFHVNYCPGSTSACAPLPSSMLYPALQ